jgi:hypothetical protein
LQAAKSLNLCATGDVVVVVSGVTEDKAGSSNTIRIVKVDEMGLEW